MTQPTPEEPQGLPPGLPPATPPSPPLTSPLPTGPAYPGPPPPGYEPPAPPVMPAMPTMPAIPPMPSGYPAEFVAYVDPMAKSRMTAGLLGIFLGALGVHRFYLGYTSIGVLQILVTIATCGIGGFWGIIEGILILGGSGIKTDADGRPLRP